MDLLGTCSFASSPCDRKSSSCPCCTLVCLPLLLLLLLVLVLSTMLFHVALLSTPQKNWLVHWVWRNCSNISMDPRPNEMPHGSNWTEFLCSDLSQYNAGYMDCNFGSRMDTSPYVILQHPPAWYSGSHIIQSAMEERAKAPSSSGAV